VIRNYKTVATPVVRLFAVSLVSEDLREQPLRVLRTQSQVDDLLRRGFSIRRHIADRVGAS
jgi:hypothetical protein